MPPRTPLGEIARKAFELAKLKPEALVGTHPRTGRVDRLGRFLQCVASSAHQVENKLVKYIGLYIRPVECIEFQFKAQSSQAEIQSF